MDLAKVNYSNSIKNDQVQSEHVSIKSKTTIKNDNDNESVSSDFKKVINLASSDEKILDVENSHIDMEIEKLNKKIEDSGRSLSYRMHESSNTIIVKIKNSATGEVIKEYPNEKNLDFITNLMEQSGLFFDKKQ